jgi:hypothetical protein
VDFPEPDVPTMATLSPACTVKWMSCSKTNSSDGVRTVFPKAVACKMQCDIAILCGSR